MSDITQFCSTLFILSHNYHHTAPETTYHTSLTSGRGEGPFTRVIKFRREFGYNI
jgi:hypothetical protein